MSRSPDAQRIVPIMPPLIDGGEYDETVTPFTVGDKKNSSAAGTACEKIVETYLLEKGCEIARPMVDNGVDLWVNYPDEGIKKIQIKKVVFQMHRDDGIFKRSGEDVRRARFDFNFQSGGRSGVGGRSPKQARPEDVDMFYHVLYTTQRQLIWETPSHLIPLRENGEFVFGKCAVLERDSWVRKKPSFDMRSHLVYSRYDPIIFKTYPEFFEYQPEPFDLTKLL